TEQTAVFVCLLLLFFCSSLDEFPSSVRGRSRANVCGLSGKTDRLNHTHPLQIWEFTKGNSSNREEIPQIPNICSYSRRLDRSHHESVTERDAGEDGVRAGPLRGPLCLQSGVRGRGASSLLAGWQRGGGRPPGAAGVPGLLGLLRSGHRAEPAHRPDQRRAGQPSVRHHPHSRPHHDHLWLPLPLHGKSRHPHTEVINTPLWGILKPVRLAVECQQNLCFFSHLTLFSDISCLVCVCVGGGGVIVIPCSCSLQQCIVGRPTDPLRFLWSPVRLQVQPSGTSLFCSDLLDDTACVALLVVGFLLLTPLLVLALAAYCRLARHLQLGMCFIPYSRAVYKNLPPRQEKPGCWGHQQVKKRDGKGSVWV
uniref:Transmembrane protein 88 a n=1 Tax=Oryzias latipes TaxID=8090 RepID=A0A3B3HP29_ORYLA